MIFCSYYFSFGVIQLKDFFLILLPLRSSKDSNRFAWVRIALILTLMAFFAALPFYVFAQSQPESREGISSPNTKIENSSEIFVLQRNDRGESICRLATPTERRHMAARERAGVVKTIYPGGRRVNDKREVLAPTVTETGTPLLPSAGLRIVLHATTQLQNNPVARDAFIVAANRWEALVSTPITVVLDVDFGT